MKDQSRGKLSSDLAGFLFTFFSHACLFSLINRDTLFWLPKTAVMGKNE
jgi:hypothetical protein